MLRHTVGVKIDNPPLSNPAHLCRDEVGHEEEGDEGEGHDEDAQELREWDQSCNNFKLKNI